MTTRLGLITVRQYKFSSVTNPVERRFSCTSVNPTSITVIGGKVLASGMLYEHVMYVVDLVDSSVAVLNGCDSGNVINGAS